MCASRACARARARRWLAAHRDVRCRSPMARTSYRSALATRAADRRAALVWRLDVALRRTGLVSIVASGRIVAGGQSLRALDTGALITRKTTTSERTQESDLRRHSKTRTLVGSFCHLGFSICAVESLDYTTRPKSFVRHTTASTALLRHVSQGPTRVNHRTDTPGRRVAAGRSASGLRRRERRRQAAIATRQLAPQLRIVAPNRSGADRLAA